MIIPKQGVVVRHPGQVPNIIFARAVIPEPDGTARIYCGAADYVQCLAAAKLSDLIGACYNR